jgi:DNA-binding NarL/FixJ family response regulator
MSLKGNLEHFPIIDVIQLLHGSRKSGVLRLTSEKGESQLVFHDGDLVSANYLNSRVRIGQVLVSAGAITEEQLTQALKIQENAGTDRKPLVITLLESNMVDETAAYNGIESLIEMTVVEVLTWKEGHFTLDLSLNNDGGGYHFSRTNFPQRILLNAQGILMESLRIFDEKVRDGSMDEILSIAGVSNLDLDAEQQGSTAQPIISSDNQNDGPSKLQHLLEEQRAMIQRSSDQSYRELDTVKKLIIEEFPTAAKEQKRHLLSLLAGPVTENTLPAKPPGIAVILITKSRLLSTMVRSICYQDAVYAVSTDNIASLDINIRLLLCQTLHLVIVLDVPHGDASQDTIQICRNLLSYPQASVVLVACSHFWENQALQALSLGIRSIIPRPCKECSKESTVQQALSFSAGFGPFLRTLSKEYSTSDDQRFFACIAALRNCKTRTEIMVAVLHYLFAAFERAVVFLVSDSGLAAEQSFGVKELKCQGISPLSNLSVTIDDQEIFEEVIKTGQMYYGFHSDSTWPHQLYRSIGRPDSPEVLLFPFIRANTVVAFIYADYGSNHASTPSIHYLDALLQYTTAQISVSAYRQKLKSLQESTDGTR